jgi:beta-xylosidase
MVKLVDSLYAIEDNYHFKTSLLLYWGAWFNAATGPIFRGSRDLMTSGNVPKPIYTGYEMLAKLGEDRLKVSGPPVGGRLGMLATRSAKQIQLLVYNFNEQDDQFDAKDEISIDLNGLSSAKEVSITEIWLDRNHHNTYRKWEAMGKPTANENVIETLKKEAELTSDAVYSKPLENDHLNIRGFLPRHSMKLYLINL